MIMGRYTTTVDTRGANPRQTAVLEAYADANNTHGRTSRYKRQVTSREPSALEMRAASDAAREVKQAVVKGTTRSLRNSQYGPGRVRQSEMIRAAVGQRTGRPVPSLKPFKQSKVQRMPQTPVKVGIIQDLSPSMTRLALVSASLRWIVAEAVDQVQGEVCAVGFSGGAWPLQAPGERDRMVRELDTGGGSHDIESSFYLVDAALDLLDSDGARVLFILGDYEWEYEQIEAVKGFVLECERAGVGVVSVVPAKGSMLDYYAPFLDNGVSRVVECPMGSGSDPQVAAAGLAPLVGQAIREAAEAAG